MIINSEDFMQSVPRFSEYFLVSAELKKREGVALILYTIYTVFSEFTLDENKYTTYRH